MSAPLPDVNLKPHKPKMSLLPTTEQLDHLTLYLSSFSGTDKGLMLLQYAPLLLTALLPKDAPRGLPVRRRGAQGVRRGLENLSSAVGDGRVLFRLFGLVPILQWYAGIVRKREAKKAARVKGEVVTDEGWFGEDEVERLQAWSMLAYYPLEHAYYLASKRVISLSPSKLVKFGLWSCRFWAVYVVLSVLSLYRKRLTLLKRAQESEENKRDTQPAMKLLNLLTIVDLAYLPLTMHWSLPTGAWSSSFPTGLFGTIAALAQLKLGWEGSRRVPAVPVQASEEAVDPAVVAGEKVRGLESGSGGEGVELGAVAGSQDTKERSE